MKTTIPAILLFVLTVAAARSAAPRPNILYFYVDDMGWGSIGPNGQAARKAAGKPHVKTPNLDRLAVEGINFTRGYGCHVCSPARSSQQSGFHQGHTFADRNDPDNAKKAMRAEDILMGDALAKAGYVTGYWGKWGYGGSQDMQQPEILNIQTLPTSHGYQYVLAELHHVRAHTFFQPTLWSAPAKGAEGGLALIPNSMAGHKDYPKTPALQDHATYPKTAYCDDVYSAAALRFVRDQAANYQKTGHPFFGLLAAQIPHAPFDEVARLPGWNKAYEGDAHFSSLPKQAQQWAAMVTRIDAHFGNILDELEKAGVANNTLVIFQSDNGGPGGPNNSVFDANGGLRGTKGSIHEGGIRVPLVMRWPAKIKPGQQSDRVVEVTDLLPTFCELAGVPAPLGVDGVSIAPFLSGDGSQRSRDFIIHEAGNGQSIIQGKYKLVQGGGSKGKGKKQKKPVAKPGFLLYDLEADHGEKTNIAAAHPERVEALKGLMRGERVDEPKGFAVTYHHWTGASGAATSKPSNWSDYVYANAGITYTTDDGAPQAAWVAKMWNKTSSPRDAEVDADLNVLALELGGKARQTLRVPRGRTVNGRNEVRIAREGHVDLNGGTLASLRWVDVLPGGTLSGSGTIEADLYAQGMVEAGDAPLAVNGTAHLGGRLVLGKQAKPGVVLKAGQVEGRFTNPGNEVVDDGGTRFAITYTDTAVSISRK